MSRPFDRQWLDSDQQRAWRLLIALMSALPQRLSRELVADSELTFHEFDVIVRLKEAPEGQLRVSALASTLGWERSRTSHQLARMESRDLVIRQRVPHDGRGAVVRPTQRGLDLIEHAAPAHLDFVQRTLFDPLTPEETLILGKALLAMARELEVDLSSVEASATLPSGPRSASATTVGQQHLNQYPASDEDEL
ncbi:MarR family winged helix-turn-helix transcriptional regulator [Luteococcus sp. Sow4_B9]|uniref:MarR family winged helix-turn-helix transcriptional regulator n=1 Tax=Luteococcus sp. Sow4_B9 TaxID=3438792 RepID=UPI003F99DDF5